MVSAPKTAIPSLLLTLLYSAYYIAFGAITRSWWLLTVGVYYCILSAVRAAVIFGGKNEHLLAKFTGSMLMALSLPLGGMVILSRIRDRGQKFHMIVMIAIAAYAFTRITLATVHWVKLRRETSARTVPLRSIAFADALVSIFSLQRSMLVTFEGMKEAEILLMNTLTGSGVCVIVFLLGLNLVVKKSVFWKSPEKDAEEKLPKE